MCPQMSPNAETTGSLVYYAEAKSIKKGAYAMLKGEPCKIVDACISKVGKHGGTKVHFTGLNVFNENRVEFIYPGSHMIEVPFTNTTTYQLIGQSDDGYMQLLSDDGKQRNDISLPKDTEVATRIEMAVNQLEDLLFAVVVFSCMGRERVTACREIRSSRVGAKRVITNEKIFKNHKYNLGCCV